MRINNIKIITLGFLLLIQTRTSAQVVTFNELNTYIQKVRIGLVDEFFNRFNGKISHPDIPVNKKDSEINNLMMLYNLSMFTSKNDSLYKEAFRMMRTVLKDSISIQFSDRTWVALAHCKGIMNGRNVKFDLYLNVQQRNEDMYKWVMTRADGKLFDITSRNTNENIMFMPDDHETNFLSLRRMTHEQPFNVNQFMSKDFNYDKTSVFAYLVYSGILKIDYVDDLEFIFTQIPGYIFHIKYFEREKNNAGWLISHFYRATNKTKEGFLETIHSHKKFSTTINECITRETVNKERTTKIDLQKNEQKRQYILRLNEKMLQLKDYISFMQNNDSLRAHYVYKAKAIGLFVENAKVYLYKKGKLKQVCNNIADFCDIVINRHVVCTSMDSLYVPSWDDKILTLRIDVDRCETLAYLRQFKENGADNSSPHISDKKFLYVYKEETEDGIEWLPMFGDLMVTIE